MKKRLTFCALMLISLSVWAEPDSHNMHVDVHRDGHLYYFNASFDTPLDACAAYRLLTDYEAAKQMPGVIESVSLRIAPDRVRVQRVADERVLFFHVRMHSVMEYTEHPEQGVSFTQLSGDSKSFDGVWDIAVEAGGSQLKFRGVWEPDTVLPLWVIDHFAKNKLVQKFEFMAQFAEQRKAELTALCHPVVAVQNVPMVTALDEEVRHAFP